VIAGVNSVIIAIDLEETLRKGSLGFSIQRTDLDPRRGLPRPTCPLAAEYVAVSNGRANVAGRRNFSRYKIPLGRLYDVPVVATATASFPLRLRQCFDGDETSDGVEVEVTTEDNARDATGVFFNRGRPRAMRLM